MRPIEFTVPASVPDALRRFDSGTVYLAGGTTLVDLMKLDVMTPRRVLDIDRLPLRGITRRRDGLHIAALERMSDVAVHRTVVQDYPVLSQALLLSASPQLRNMASIGGNLLQRTRCSYFRDITVACNKREPGSGCPAREGVNRSHAVLGTSDSCVATHASDLAVALVALEARVTLTGPDGTRALPLEDFYRLPGDTPEVENELRPGEIITEVVVPPLHWARRSVYLKVRDRQSYEFALTSAAVAAELRGRTVRDVRIAVGGVATRPWRLRRVEEALIGQPLRESTVVTAVERAADGARPLTHNAFKPALLRSTIARALMDLVN
ncbi:xanthine dehydrogenase family protein subunit M [Streptomyces sp. NPDC093252]|uniref:FAD binding domain-containing protein n=1 Tax=Streptomyces sp. NPDC093252 TaxID=3154980 RepID=UPI003446D216